MQALKPPPKPPTAAEVAAGAKPTPNQVSYWQAARTPATRWCVSVSYGGTKTWRIRFNDDDGKPRTAKLEASMRRGDAEHLGVEAARREGARRSGVEAEAGRGRGRQAAGRCGQRRGRAVADAKKVEARGMRTAHDDAAAGRAVRDPGMGRPLDWRAEAQRRGQAARQGAGDGGALTRTPRVGGRVMADKVFNLLSSMMHWWAGKSDDFVPAHRQGRCAATSARDKTRERVLDDAQAQEQDWPELQALWAGHGDADAVQRPGAHAAA